MISRKFNYNSNVSEKNRKIRKQKYWLRATLLNK